MIGLVGRKVGMTRVFTEEGVSIPVTVVEVEANRISHPPQSLSKIFIASGSSVVCLENLYW